MSVTQWFQSQAADFNTGYKIWSHGMTSVSIPEVNMLENSSTLAVSVPINLFIKLDFDSVSRRSRRRIRRIRRRALEGEVKEED